MKGEFAPVGPSLAENSSQRFLPREEYKTQSQCRRVPTPFGRKPSYLQGLIIHPRQCATSSDSVPDAK